MRHDEGSVTGANIKERCNKFDESGALLSKVVQKARKWSFVCISEQLWLAGKMISPFLEGEMYQHFELGRNQIKFRPCSNDLFNVLRGEIITEGNASINRLTWRLMGCKRI